MKTNNAISVPAQKMKGGSTFTTFTIVFSQILFILIFSCFILNCNDTNDLDNENPEWSSLDFTGKSVFRLRLYTPYLYVCAKEKGLWRKNIVIESSEWEFLGISDTSADNYIGRVLDVVVRDQDQHEIMVAYYPMNTSYHGIYKTMEGGRIGFHPIVDMDTTTPQFS